MEDGSCKLDGGDGGVYQLYKMHEPTAEWLFVVLFFSPLFSLFCFLQFFFFFLLLFHHSAPRHISFSGLELAQTILSFSLSCLLCFLSLLKSSSGVMHVMWLWMEGRSGGRNQEALWTCEGEKREGRRHVEACGAAAAWEKA